MSDRRDAPKVEIVLWGDDPEEIGGAGQILERARPAAPQRADPPVLDVPGGDARVRQCRRKRSQWFKACAARVQAGKTIGPAAAVDDDRHGVRTDGLRQTQLTELERIGAIG